MIRCYITTARKWDSSIHLIDNHIARILGLSSDHLKKNNNNL
jgi:hypothetical protein